MNKSFEALEQIAIHMCDTCFPTNITSDRIEKLEEEFAELMQQLTKIIKPGNHNANDLKDEMGDVLFILLHLANKFGFTASDLLHHASCKILNRIKDPNYNR